MLRSVEDLNVGMALCSLHNEVLVADAGYSGILGRDDVSGLGLTMQDITHPEDRGCNDRMLDMLRATRAPFRISKRYLVADKPIWVENRVSWLGGEGDEARLIVLSRRLHSGEVARAPLTADKAERAADTAGYIRDMAAQLARMADQSQLPTTAMALRLAELLMSDEHEVLAPGVEG
jgi:hypothetical protein